MNRRLAPFFRVVLPAILVLSLLPLRPVAIAAPVSGKAKRPVIIVGEPSFDEGPVPGPGSQAVPLSHAQMAPSKQADTALGRYLTSVGYVLGRDLFEIGVSGLRDLSDGALQLAIGVKEASRPQLECDIVASGLSGLIARYALENGDLDDVNVVNLVMVAAPNRGTFLADVVKSVLEIVRQESLLEKETRGQRFLPSIKDALGLQDDEELRSIKSLTQARALAAPPWEDEASWVSQRSAALWEPLYAEYVKNRYFRIPYVAVDSPKETFAGWVRRSLPAVWEQLMIDAEWPKSKEQDLSLPYYEYLSMEVARNQYVMRTASGGSLVKSLFSEPYIPADLKDAAIHYGLKILRHYAEKALVTLKAEAQEFVADRAVRFTGLGVGPDSPFISGLIKEDLLINLGTSSTKRFERIPANLGLKALNRSSQTMARNRRTRYVSIGSRLSNPWGLVWPQLAPNDCLLEVDSCVAPVGPGDLVAVFSGILRLPGKDVLDDKRVQRYIYEVLNDLAGSSGSEVSGQGSLIALDASSWEPQWWPVGTTGRVTIGVTALPDGWQCQVWEESSRDPGAGHGPRPGQGLMWAFDQGGNYPVRLTPGTDRLGFRLVRSGPSNPVFGRSVCSAYAEETEARVFVALAEDEAPPLIQPDAGDEPVGDPVGSDSPAGDEPVGGDSPAPGGDADSSDGEDDWPDDLPTVRVVYRSKHTTLKKPKETVHKYWVIDFGDGTQEKVDGNPSLVIDHLYAGPGTYEVTAESYGDGEDPLYVKTWDVSVSLAGETRRFTCQSIAPLNVQVILNGPKKWVTGKRAVFTAGAVVDLPPNAELVSVKIDPGEIFGVVWERAGDFIVGCAASLIVNYLLEDALIEVENTYLVEVPVTVLTTGVTQ